MIPKEAFWSIAAVMGVSCAFGFALRGLWDKAAEARKTANRRRWMDDFEADHDHWDEEKTCFTCRHENKEWWQEPCNNCNRHGSGWEAKR